MKLATFNLYQFAKPGTFWYEEKANNTHTPAAWTEKKGWILNQLQEMDADVVGFQEIFEVDELRDLCSQAGYPHFNTVDAPAVSDENNKIFVGPVVGIASRHPIVQASAVPIDPMVIEQLPVSDDFRFSRTPVRAVVDVPAQGHLVVYVAHLKSKRPIADLPDLTGADWETTVHESMRATSRGHTASLLQRGAEATALYHAMSSEIAADADTPIVVLGDLNDDPASIPMEAITMRGRIFEIAEISSGDWPSGTMPMIHNRRFSDAWTVAPQLDEERAPTHIFKGKGGVLDYILVSNTLTGVVSSHRARVVSCEVLNSHLFSDGVGDKRQSDHGQVVVELAFTGKPPFRLPGLAGPAPAPAPAPPLTPVVQPQAGGRDAFLAEAGGTFENHESYSSWRGGDKWDNFWSFFFDNNYGWVQSAYGAIPISTLHQKQRYSIEHIIPQSFLKSYLDRNGAPQAVRRGATVNPYNFVAAERDANSTRDSFPFNWDGDQIRRPFRFALNPAAYGSAGFDDENEWVIPSRSRGDLARAILYMVIIYNIKELYNRHIDQLVHYAKVDPCTQWELDYGLWVEGMHAIKNPFIARPDAARRWLDDADLMASIRLASG